MSHIFEDSYLELDLEPTTWYQFSKSYLYYTIWTISLVFTVLENNGTSTYEVETREIRCTNVPVHPYEPGWASVSFQWVFVFTETRRSVYRRLTQSKTCQHSQSYIRNELFFPIRCTATSQRTQFESKLFAEISLIFCTNRIWTTRTQWWNDFTDSLTTNWSDELSLVLLGIKAPIKYDLGHSLTDRLLHRHRYELGSQIWSRFRLSVDFGPESLRWWVSVVAVSKWKRCFLIFRTQH